MKNKLSFRERYGPWALVTGGASGIGAEFARQLAARGLNLVLADLQEEPAKKLARELVNSEKIEARAVAVDLAAPNFLPELLKKLKGVEIGLLVNNAGHGSAGEFMKTDIAEMSRTVAVNCAAPLFLTRHFGPAMAERGRGGIIFLSSSSALQGTPMVANYAGTKAYNLVLGEALWNELRPYGVDVLALCPGATNTPAIHASGARIDRVPGMPYMEPGPVVAEALAALGRRPSLVAGRGNRIAAFFMTRLMSRRRAVTLIGRHTRMLYPGH